MIEKTQLVIEHDFDSETIEELKTLRSIRLALAKKQLKEAEETIDQMIARNLIPANEKREYLNELKIELQTKIDQLRNRECDDGLIYFDEIELYTKLLDVQ
jgi:hypothetical protein